MNSYRRNFDRLQRRNGSSFRGRGTFRLQRNFRNGWSKEKPSVTKEELDRELDEYMKKDNHPKIDVSDLK